jgi:hypothetical protein
MSIDREQLWGELEAQAQRWLEHPKEVEPRDAIRRYGSLLRLWHYPAFAPQQTWTILTPGRKGAPGSRPVVREVTWDRPADYQRVIDPVQEVQVRVAGWNPSITLREAVLPEDELQALLEVGSNLSVPLLVFAKSVGLDGAYFGLETYEFSPHARVQWWCDGPVEWRHFTDWVTELRGFLQRCLDRPG